MEINDANLSTLSVCLQQTLSPDINIRKPAEKHLESVEATKNYPLLLLELLIKDGVEVNVRISAAITFKNYTKRNWRVVDDSPDKIHEEDRNIIKERIVTLMLSSPEQIQRQLSDAISIIGREDFPKKWPNLIGEMVTKFQSGDFHMINGVLRTAHSIFKRYRHEFKSQELWTEIKFVLDNFALPFTNLFEATMHLAETHATNPSALMVIFSSLVLICKIFHSLNYQDLPEHFEDNMAKWMGHFLTLLTVDNKLLKTEDEEEAGLLEQVRSQICDNVSLYAQKYDEEFSPHLPKFVEAIWHLLVNTGLEAKYDLLVSYAIQFLASVADRPRNKDLFASSETLTGICENVIVPNMNFRTADEELFEDNPDEYIRKDIEGSDVDTRRRAACDLVKSLAKLFEGPVIENFSKYVVMMLDEYSKNPASNWAKKDAAIYLVTSLAARGHTQKHGITQTSQLVNIQDFYHAHILPDLKSPNIDELPVIKADAIKYLMIFRNQLPADDLIQCVPVLILHLTAKSHVCHSYAAYALERIFTVKGPNGSPAVTKESIEKSIEPLLVNLFNALDIPGSEENEFVMKAIMRSFSLLQETTVSYVSTLMDKLANKLVSVSKNPSKPHFNHYLFESLCIIIKNTCKVQPAAVTTFETGLFSAFELILQQDVQEFIPYVFQIMSLLLEMHSRGVPETYMKIFPCLLTPELWTRPGNIPPLVRLLQAFIEKGAHQIPADKMSGLLGVFQKLIASKANDHEGFYLMNAIVEFCPEELIKTYLQQVFVLLFKRLTSSKTTKFVKSLIVFFSLYAIKYGSSALIEIVERIQPGLFAMVLEKVYIPDVQKVSGQSEKKISAVGITKLLTEAPEMFQENFHKFWVPLLQSLIGLFELPEDTSIPDNEHFVEIEDTPGYQTAYAKLMFAGKNDRDPCQGVGDVKVNLAKGLHKLSVSHPGKLMPIILSGLQPEALNFVQQYITGAGVTIV